MFRRLPIALIALLTAAAAGEAQAPPAARARKFWDIFSRGDPAGKSLAFDLLEPADDPAVIAAGFRALESPHPLVAAAAVEFLSGTRGDKALASLADGLGHKNPLVRYACATAIAAPKGDAEARPEPLVARLKDDWWLVREAAAFGIGRTRYALGFVALAEAAADPDPRVRTSAVAALGRIADLAGEAAVKAALSDKAWQARSAAIEAVSLLKARSAFGALIECWAAEKGRLKLEARRVMVSLAGRDLGDDPDNWREWWGVRVKRNGETGRMEPESDGYVITVKSKAPRKFFDAETESRRVLFVLDASASMSSFAKPRRSMEGARSGTPTRHAVLVDEIAMTLRAFEDGDLFNIIVFGTKVESWKPALVPASASTKSDAVGWLKSRPPAGETNLFDGLARAFGVSEGAIGGGKAYFDEMGGMKGPMGFDDGPDTIFLLSDGVPNVGVVKEGEKIAREVARANRVRRLVIHGIAVGQFQAEFLSRIALENGGSYKSVGE